MTSNLESDDEDRIHRKRRPPARYMRALASDNDDDDDVPPTPKVSRIASRPTYEEGPLAPRTCISSTPIFTPRAEFFSDKTGQTEPCTSHTENCIASAFEMEEHFRVDNISDTFAQDKTPSTNVGGE